MMPIRVLHVVTYMGRGGLETMLMNYYRCIDRDRVQFDFLVHREFTADYDEEILALGGKIFRLPRLNPFSRTYLAQLDDFFHQHKEYKIVHSHLDCMAGIPLKYAKRNGVSVRIAHAHNSNQNKDMKYLLKLLYKRKIPNYSSHLFACSAMAGNWMFGGEAFSVLPNAIDARQYEYDEAVREKVRNAFEVAPDTVVVGHVGRFSEQKNHSFLIDIFAEVAKLHPNSRLLLVGDGELRQGITEKCEKMGLSDLVIFAGLREDVPELLQAMDVFVLPSHYEGMPLVLIEAQASGLPSIRSDKVPAECEKTHGLVKEVKLSDSALQWAHQALDVRKIPRRSTFEEIQAAGFDIYDNARKLEQFYLELGS